MSPEQAEGSARHRHADGRVLAGRAAVRAAHGHDAVRRARAAQQGVRGDAARDPRGRAAAAQHAHLRTCPTRSRPSRRGAASEPRRLTTLRARRPGLDRDEGAGEGPRAPLRDGQRPGGRRAALPRRRAGQRRPAEQGLPPAQVRAAAPGPDDRVGRRARRARLGNRRHDDRADRPGAAARLPSASAPTAQEQAAEATRQAAIANAVSQFQSDMLATADPEKMLGDKVTVVQAISAAVKELDAGRLKDQPHVEAAVRDMIGTTLRALGRYGEAEPVLRRALELQRQHLPPQTLEIGAAPTASPSSTSIRRVTPRPSRCFAKRWPSVAAPTPAPPAIRRSFSATSRAC